MQKDPTDLSYRSFHFLFEYHQKEKRNKLYRKVLAKRKIIPPKPNRINPTTVCRKIMALAYTTQSCFLSWECLMSLLLKA